MEVSSIQRRSNKREYSKYDNRQQFEECFGADGEHVEGRKRGGTRCSGHVDFGPKQGVGVEDMPDSVGAGDRWSRSESGDIEQYFGEFGLVGRTARKSDRRISSTDFS